MDETKKKIALFRESKKDQTKVRKIVYFWLKVKAYRFCLKIIYYLIIAFKSSDSSFEALKDQMHHFQEEAWHLLEKHQKLQTVQYYDNLKLIHQRKHA